MITLAEIFRCYSPRLSDRLPVHQRAVMVAIEQCRTPALGDHIYTCPTCAATQYGYHSCCNRHCPACQHMATQTWLA